ncbi:helix-turn-helix domain-containing protein [uncultured Microbacterium sp.]|uniref:helix-turn-helix transcriptional regulator n=1 Tax=uncultured Microbacterium sp. TaxID=191216 RepID=UPI002631C7C2|nr:helix-turn-helix domain-containing protein [uncultured Microbacterium sp.]
MRSAPIKDSAMLGHLLVELRAEAGLTQRELADELGVSQRYIVELEQGKQTKSVERLLRFISQTGGKLYLETSSDA